MDISLSILKVERLAVQIEIHVEVGFQLDNYLRLK